MTLVKRNGSLLNQLPMLFDDLFNKDYYNFSQFHFSDSNTTIPAVNIKETAANYEVEVAAPGMSKNDFKIELEGNLLTIASQKTVEAGQHDDRRVHKEFSYQSFNRSFSLQKEVVDVDKIKATYEDGILKLEIPKIEKAKQKTPGLIQVS